MATFDTSRPLVTDLSPAGRIGHVFWLQMGKLLDWNDRRKTRQMLLTLTDRELNDIGLCRGDVERVL